MRYLNLIKNISNWHLHLKYKFGLDTSDPLIFTAKNNIRFAVPKRLYHEFKEIFLENAYVVGQQKKVTKKNPIIIDIGANVGFFSMFTLSKSPDCHIYSYEPIESNFKQLSANQQMNSEKNLKCFNMAVCGHKGTVKIHFDTNDQFTTSATIFDDSNDVANPDYREIPCLRLSDIFDDNNIEKCDFLKLDCEGAEYDVLYNAPPKYLERIDQMAVEIHQGKKEGENLESLRIFLKKNNFKLFQFDGKPHMLWASR